MDQWAVVCCDAKCVLPDTKIKTKTHANNSTKCAHLATLALALCNTQHCGLAADYTYKYTVYTLTHVNTPTGI